MHYLKLPGMDSAVRIFDICQAHAQLESDYSAEGILRERPSNARRKMSTSTQISRMGYDDPSRWVDIVPRPGTVEDDGDEDVRDIYLINVLKWKLPIDDEMRAFILKRYTPEFLEQFWDGPLFGEGGK